MPSIQLPDSQDPRLSTPPYCLLTPSDEEAATKHLQSTKYPLQHPPKSAHPIAVLLQIPSTVRPILQNLFISAVPSPLHHRLFPTLCPPQKQSNSTLRPTAYLDGLRGIASAIVLIYHYTQRALPPYLAYYNQGDADKVPSSPLQLPFIRLLFAGEAAVHVFFVVSGVALSLSPLRAARRGDFGKVCTTLSSSVFRRGIRLFLPMLMVSFLSMVTFWAGWVPYKDWKMPVEEGSSFSVYFWDWLSVTGERFEMVWEWGPIVYLNYGGHTWTIVVEMCMSLLLFVVLLGVCRLRTWIRGLVLGAVGWYAFRCGLWAASEFLAGALVAELGLVQEEWRLAAASAVEEGEEEGVGDEEKGGWNGDVEVGEKYHDDDASSTATLQDDSCEDESQSLYSPSKSSTSTAVSNAAYSYNSSNAAKPLFSRLRPQTGIISTPIPIRLLGMLSRKFWPLFCWTQFIIAISIFNWPENSNETDNVWGFRTLNAHIPLPYSAWPTQEYNPWPYFIPASISIVLACQQLPTLRRLLTCNFSLYLADISFALYLVHFVLVEAVLNQIMGPLWRGVVGENWQHTEAGFWGRGVVWGLGLVVFGGVCVWVADVFWRVVDVPTVRFARWVEGKCLREEAV